MHSSHVPLTKWTSSSTPDAHRPTTLVRPASAARTHAPYAPHARHHAQVRSPAALHPARQISRQRLAALPAEQRRSTRAVGSDALARTVSSRNGVRSGEWGRCMRIAVDTVATVAGSLLRVGVGGGSVGAQISMAGFWRQPQQAEYLPEDFKPLDYSRKDSWHACYAQDGGRNLTAWVPTVGTPILACPHTSASHHHLLGWFLPSVTAPPV